MPLLLSEHDVRDVLPLDDLIDAMQHALAAFSRGRVAQPLRTVLTIGAEQAFFGVMPAYLPDTPAVGTKLVTVFGGNAAIGLPTHLATIVLLDPATGELRAMMDGRYITEVRTAAVSAVSVRLLARGDAGTLSILGSGVQARSHLEAIARICRLRRVTVWSPNDTSRASFVRDMQPRLDIPLVAAASPPEAVHGADLIVVATAAHTPVLRSEWVADGAHICAVGACRPDQREMETSLVARARLFVDSRAGALAEAGDVVLPIAEGAIAPEHIAGELGEVASGGVAGRRSSSEVTLFKSLGMAVEDVAAAHLAYERAAARGLGRYFVLT
jgi:ornithine cyclodeaminase